MALTDTQVRQLKAKLEGTHVRTRKANGVDLHYVEGWHVIAEANRIFGYDAWDRRTLVANCVWSGASGAAYGAAYTAKVRVSVRAGDIIIVREGSGTGEGTAPTPGQAHELALKVPRLTPPSERSPPLATLSVLPFMTANSLACARPKARRFRSAHGSCARRLVP
jgi:Rad52/22 family double-strand break repair protein